MCSTEVLSASSQYPDEQKNTSTPNSSQIEPGNAGQAQGPCDDRNELALPLEEEVLAPVTSSCTAAAPVTPLTCETHDALCPEGCSENKCGVCGMDVDKLSRQEHEDLHLAIEIEKEDRRISKILEQGHRISHSKRAKKRPSALGSLDAYLIKRR